MPFIGLVSVTSPVLQQDGLSTQEIQWAETQIAGYNGKIIGAFTPVLNGIQPMSLPAVAQPMAISTALIRSMSTANLSYGWFTASQPYFYTEDFWWGQSTTLNELATTKMEGALWMLVGGATVGSVAATKLSFIPYSAGLAYNSHFGAPR